MSNLIFLIDRLGHTVHGKGGILLHTSLCIDIHVGGGRQDSTAIIFVALNSKFHAVYAPLPRGCV